ncbi:hypothetical protein L208DRAFT_1317448 [Tricholoma matsutake]|nr:hypothetical protein L208DRAFT_1317448 [Tricholoma matsutake 945]
MHQSILNSDEAHKFVSQIELLYPILDDRQQPFVAPSGLCQTQAEEDAKQLSKFLSHIQANANKQLPFCDRAPSRMRILEEGGPFSPDIVSTPAGLFTALIFRGVTYHTDFLFDQECIFQHLSDWQVLHKELSKMHSPEYFCDRSAYGQRSIAQDVSHVSAYWEAAQDFKLGGWVMDTRPIEFEVLYNNFYKGRLCSRKAFPGFGPLKSFLLAANYAITNKATTPLLASIGKIIYQIGCGALKGLSCLGFTCTDVATTAQAFTAVHNHLLDVIPENHRQQMGFGIFFVEHTLCKYGRLDTALFKSVYRKKMHILS